MNLTDITIILLRMNKHKSLSISQLIILFILENIKQNKIQSPSAIKLSEFSGYSTSSINRIIPVLKEQGYVTTENLKTGKRGNEFLISTITEKGSELIKLLIK